MASTLPPPTVSPGRAGSVPAEQIIQDAAGWILRVGSITSVAVMLVGLALSFRHGALTITYMRHARFDYHPGVIWSGICAGDGKAIIEAGVYLLVFTPILRVFTSMVIFAVVERDWLYALITLVVLAMTLAGLLFLH
jgi:uncharacterized membrane protein